MNRITAACLKYKNQMQKLVDKGELTSISISAGDKPEIIIAQKRKENMAKKETETVFPKITGTAKLKQIIIKPEGVDLRFENLTLTPNQISDLARWESNSDELQISIVQTQGNFLET